jgi:hypothetical protein
VYLFFNPLLPLLPLKPLLPLYLFLLVFIPFQAKANKHQLLHLNCAVAYLLPFKQQFTSCHYKDDLEILLATLLVLVKINQNYLSNQ